MKFKTINLIHDMLVEATTKAREEYAEADRAAKEYFDMLKVTLGDSVTKVELDKIYGKSEQHKRVNEASLKSIHLEQAQDDFMKTDWR